MKSKIITIVLVTLVFAVALICFFLISRQSIQKSGEQILGSEGEFCSEVEDLLCQEGLVCQKNACVPDLKTTEIIDPVSDRDFYLVASGGPFKYDYILHVDRLVVTERLSVYIGKEYHWFKPRREEKVRPYEIKVPRGQTVQVSLRHLNKKEKPEFRGQIYLTIPEYK